MEQIDLKHLIEQHPEVLTDYTKLKAYILDLYPNCKRGMVNILVAIQQCGIVAEMQASKNPAALDMSRWKKVLDDNYAFDGATAEICLQIWWNAVGTQLKTKAPTRVNTKAKQSIGRTKTKKVNSQGKKAFISSDLQNDQNDWFEYDKTTLLRLKAQYRNYKGIIYIPDNVTSIDGWAFKGCKDIAGIKISESVISIGWGAFEGCKSLSGVYINNLAKWCSISFSDNCDSNPLYYAHNLYSNDQYVTDLIIPDGVTSVGMNAFHGCTGLVSVTIPDSVTSIGYYAFSGCSGLTSIKVDSGNATYHSQGNCVIETANKVLVLGCKTSVIPDDGSVTSIGKDAFYDCTNLTSITIPNGATSIGDRAFFGCTGLTSITFPNSVASLGDSAFSGCSGLTSIKVASRNAAYHSQGNCVIETANKVLVLGCKTSVIPDDGSVTSIGEGAFLGCTDLMSVIIPDSVKSIGSYAFSGCADLTSITIPSSVKRIGRNAFAGCRSLTCIMIPDSVKSIGSYAFSGCADLTSITIPSSVKSIGKDAFADCRSLTGIIIPNSVKIIGDYAFKNCIGLTSIILSNSVKSIGASAFAGCKNLTMITIPSSMTSIGREVFKGCTRLTSIIFEGTKAQWKAIEKGFGWKGYEWNHYTGSYVVHCTDGNISKNES